MDTNKEVKTMSQVSYSSYNKDFSKDNQKHEFKVGFFNNLQNDGDEVVVRFPYSTTDEFHIATVHTIKVGKIFRKISCLEKDCPLCAKKDRYQARFFCKILAYEKDDKQNIITKSYVWDRPIGFGKEIVDALDEGIELGLYPAGSKIEDVVFKIKRSGKHGDKGTTFKVQPANPNIYKPELYGKKFEDLKDCKIAGLFYMVKTADEIKTYLEKGEFPTKAYTAPVSTKAVPDAQVPVSKPADVNQAAKTQSVTQTKVVVTPTIKPKTDAVQTPVQPVQSPTPANNNPAPRRYRF
jgi:hypothetical protein